MQVHNRPPAAGWPLTESTEAKLDELAPILEKLGDALLVALRELPHDTRIDARIEHQGMRSGAITRGDGPQRINVSVEMGWFGKILVDFEAMWPSGVDGEPELMLVATSSGT